MAKRKSALSGLKLITFILAIIPVVALVLIILSLVLKSTLAIQTAGWSLFSGTFDITRRLLRSAARGMGDGPGSPGSHDNRGAGILVPGYFSHDFSAGFLSTVIRWMLGILSGIRRSYLQQWPRCSSISSSGPSLPAKDSRKQTS